MNKILPYTVIAILLGTVIMFAPLALLGPGDSHLEKVPEAVESGDQERASENGGTLESNDLWARPEIQVEPQLLPVPEPSEPVPQEPELTMKTTEISSNLSPIGLMTIPSFLIALGVFVFLRQRIN